MTPAELAARGLRVKPLVWVKENDEGYYSNEGDVRITSNGKGWGLSPRDWPHFGDYDIPTLEAAKATAEADYQSRVAACLDA